MGRVSFRSRADVLGAGKYGCRDGLAVRDGSRGETLVAVPYQTPERPAATPHCVPERIEPILAGGLFGWAVRYAAGVNANLEDLEEAESHANLEREFAEWEAKQDLPETAKFEASLLVCMRSNASPCRTRLEASSTLENSPYHWE